MSTQLTASWNSNSTLPIDFVLAAFPNPFNPTTNLNFTLPLEQHVKLHVYDLAGREVIQLADGVLPAGVHNFELDGIGLASGVYIAYLATPTSAQKTKLVLLK